MTDHHGDPAPVGRRGNMTERLWYFTYGSNLDPERFRDRVGDFDAMRQATLPGWRLRFSSRVESEGGGGAVIEPAPDEAVVGAIFRIERSQIEAMDAVEFDPRRDRDRSGIRRTVTVDAGDERLSAEVYTIDRSGPGRRPSATYLGHILRGLRQAGYDDAALAAVESVAAGEPANKRGSDDGQSAI